MFCNQRITGNAQEHLGMSRAYFSTRARKMDPQMDPHETGLAPTFSFDSLSTFAVAVSPTVADLASSAHWQLGPTSTARTNERLSQAHARFGAPMVSLEDLSTSINIGRIGNDLSGSRLGRVLRQKQETDPLCPSSCSHLPPSAGRDGLQISLKILKVILCSDFLGFHIIHHFPK